MRKIQDYLDTAISLNRLQSDRHLARKLELSAPSVNRFRQGTSLPSPDTMVKLARLAGIDEQVALVELSFWGADGEAKSAYERILRRISTFLPATLLGLAAMHPATAQAAENLNSLPHFAPHALPQECVMGCMYIVYYENETKTAFNKASQKQCFTAHSLRYVSAQLNRA